MPNRRAALERLRRWSPDALHRVTRTLRGAGGRAYVVGGVVRDAFLNRRGADWDVATDLPPARVATLFEQVVRSGEKHGTIMVIDRGLPIEVTTFRGEGPYVDGRRPAFVEFHRDIERDLARRDFTMNAIAVDLDRPEWVDPFEGALAIARRQIASVGDARERFREDGLRPLRAVRFASTLRFEVDEPTRAALGLELDTFERVAWERKRVEMEKLLAGPAVEPALRLLEASGLAARLVPELSVADLELDCLAQLPADPWLRWCAWGDRAALDAEAWRGILERFKASGAVARRVQSWSAALREARKAGVPSAPGPAFRRWLSRVGLQGARGAIDIWQARGELDRVAAGRLRRCLRRPPPHRVADLAIGGADLLAMGLAGPEVGRILSSLLAWVVEEPRRNRRSVLLAAAHRLSTPGSELEDG